MKAIADNCRQIPYYSIIGAARLAGVSEGLIRRALKLGEMQECRTLDGSSPLIARNQLQKWIAKRK